MKNICFVQHVKLTNVSGRISYISSEKKQENLYALMNGAPKESLITVKKALISKPAAESIRESGGKSDPEKYNSIIVRGIVIIAEMCRLLKRESRETWAEVWGKALIKLMEVAIQNVGERVWNTVREHRRDYER